MPLPAWFPELASLDLFVSVVEHGSLSRAAAAHSISQPSASERIAQLERQLGVQLLDRSPTGSVPTPEGALVVNWAATVLASADELALAVATLRPARGGHLAIAASFTIAEHLLPRWLGVIHASYPDVAVELEVVNSTSVLDRVRAGDAELGFIESPSPTTGLASRRIGVDEMVVVVPPDHPWCRRRRALSPGELATTPLVMREAGSGTRDTLTSALAGVGLTSPPAMLELGSTAAVKAAVGAGAGPAVLSRLAVDAEIASGRLVVVAVDDVDLHRSLRAVWRRVGRLAAPAAALVAKASV